MKLLFNNILLITVLAFQEPGIAAINVSHTSKLHQSKNTIKPKSRFIVIDATNLKPNAFDYVHWSGIYHPSSIKISANGAPIDLGKKNRLKIQGEAVTITYECSFVNKTHISKKIVTFKLGKQERYPLNFSWKQPQRIILESAQMINYK